MWQTVLIHKSIHAKLNRGKDAIHDINRRGSVRAGEVTRTVRTQREDRDTDTDTYIWPNIYNAEYTSIM